MARRRIVIIEDESDLLEVMTAQLESEGFEVFGFSSFEDFSWRHRTLSPDLIITDWRLPGKSGFDLVTEVRKENNDVPILMITGQPANGTGVQAINEGADDYLTKPLEMDFLIAKINRLISRRGQPTSEAPGSQFRLDRRTGELFYKDQAIKFTDTEFEIFSHLFANADNLVEREQLEAHTSQQRSLDVHMHSIRRKISALPVEIQTLKHKGYRLRFAPMNQSPEISSPGN